MCFAAFIQRRMFRVGVLLPEQIDDVALGVVIFQLRGCLPRRVGWQVLQAVLPAVEARTTGRVESHGPLRIEVGVGRRVGDDKAWVDPVLAVGEQGIALHDLGAAGMAGDDDLFHFGKLLPVTDSRNDVVEYLVGTDRVRPCG
ncbi:hypothetical protein D3C84_824700 [compost metagenome]